MVGARAAGDGAEQLAREAEDAACDSVKKQRTTEPRHESTILLQSASDSGSVRLAVSLSDARFKGLLG